MYTQCNKCKIYTQCYWRNICYFCINNQGNPTAILLTNVSK